MLSVRKKEGRPAGVEPEPEGQTWVLPLHHGHHEAGTTGFEPAAFRPDKRVLSTLSYAPESQAAHLSITRSLRRDPPTCEAAKAR